MRLIRRKSDGKIEKQYIDNMLYLAVSFGCWLVGLHLMMKGV